MGPGVSDKQTDVFLRVDWCYSGLLRYQLNTTDDAAMAISGKQCGNTSIKVANNHIHCHFQRHRYFRRCNCHDI